MTLMSSCMTIYFTVLVTINLKDFNSNWIGKTWTIGLEL